MSDHGGPICSTCHLPITDLRRPGKVEEELRAQIAERERDVVRLRRAGGAARAERDRYELEAGAAWDLAHIRWRALTTLVEACRRIEAARESKRQSGDEYQAAIASAEQHLGIAKDQLQAYRAQQEDQSYCYPVDGDQPI